jgi:hypothetical protein
MTTIVTHYLNTSASLQIEARKAELSSQATKEGLQADLIKKFVEGPTPETVRGNLRFLVDAGLLPSYAKDIIAYLTNNPTAAPQVGAPSTSAQSSIGPVSLINEMIAAVAAARLSPGARAKVEQLLDGETLVEAANWLTLQIGRPEYAFARSLRFISVPREALSVDVSRDCKEGQCLIGGIERYRAVMKNLAETKQARAEALRFLVALVSDIHRPLHVSYADDYGGNAVRVTVTSRSVANIRSTNLHAFWDNMPVVRDREPVDKYARQLLAQLGQREIGGIEASSSPLDWAQEGLKITENIYSGLPPNGILDDDYTAKGILVVEAQIVRAGARLAKLLNTELQ